MSPRLPSYDVPYRAPRHQVADRHAWDRGAETPPGNGKPNNFDNGTLYYAQSLGSINDNGSGRYTGSAGASINWPSAIWHHYAEQFGQVATTDITTAATTFGSFAEARTALNAKVSGDWDLSLSITERTTPTQLIDRLGGLAPLKIYRSMLDGKFKALVYKQTPDTYDYFLDPFGNNYSWKYSEDMAPKPKARLSPIDAVVNEVHVRYGGFAPDGSLTKDTWVSPDGSDDGSGNRDQTGALGAANDREARAVRSRDFYGQGVTGGFQQSMTVECPEIYTDAVAVAMFPGAGTDHASAARVRAVPASALSFMGLLRWVTVSDTSGQVDLARAPTAVDVLHGHLDPAAVDARIGHVGVRHRLIDEQQHDNLVLGGRLHRRLEHDAVRGGLVVDQQLAQLHAGLAVHVLELTGGAVEHLREVVVDLVRVDAGQHLGIRDGGLPGLLAGAGHAALAQQAVECDVDQEGGLANTRPGHHHA